MLLLHSSREATGIFLMSLGFLAFCPETQNVSNAIQGVFTFTHNTLGFRNTPPAWARLGFHISRSADSMTSVSSISSPAAPRNEFLPLCAVSFQQVAAFNSVSQRHFSWLEGLGQRRLLKTFCFPRWIQVVIEGGKEGKRHSWVVPSILSFPHKYVYLVFFCFWITDKNNCLPQSKEYATHRILQPWRM